VSKVRQQLASLVSSDPEDVVMIPNTTSGMNAIFRSLLFVMGDRILHFSTVYNAMGSLVQYLVDTSGGNVSKLVFNLTYPISNDDVVENLDRFLTETQDPQKPIRIAIVDHISSSPAVILPIERIIPLLQSRGIRVVIDGAHAIGQIPVNITALQPDYYLTNCHKWLYAARGCSVMYVDKKYQGEVHPAHISSGYKNPADFQQEFFWTGTQTLFYFDFFNVILILICFYALGTMDYSPYMTVTAALEFRTEIGGEEVIRNYTHGLAKFGGEYLAGRYGTEVLQSDEQMGSMVDVRLPLLNPDDPTINIEWWIDTLLYEYAQVS